MIYIGSYIFCTQVIKCMVKESGHWGVIYGIALSIIGSPDKFVVAQWT